MFGKEGKKYTIKVATSIVKEKNKGNSFLASKIIESRDEIRTIIKISKNHLDAETSFRNIINII